MRRLQVYRLRRPNLPKGYQRAASAAVFCLLAAGAVRAADVCPAPPKHKRSTSAVIIPSDDHRIRIESDGASLDANGFAVLTGHVQLHQDQRTISADRVTYDEKTGKVTVAGSVDFEDPRLGVKSSDGAVMKNTLVITYSIIPTIRPSTKAPPKRRSQLQTQQTATHDDHLAFR